MKKNILIAILVIVVLIGRITLFVYFFEKCKEQIHDRTQHIARYDYEYKSEDFYRKQKYTSLAGGFSIWFPGNTTPRLNPTLQIQDSLFYGAGVKYHDSTSHASEFIAFFPMDEQYARMHKKEMNADDIKKDFIAKGYIVTSTQVDFLHGPMGDYIALNLAYNYIDKNGWRHMVNFEQRRYINHAGITCATIFEETNKFPSPELVAFFDSFEWTK